MPAKRRTEASTSSGVASPASPQHDDDDMYKLKRKKNNQAVQRTREKLRKSAEERKTRIDELKQENIKLKAQIESETKNLTELRELIIKGSNSKDDQKLIDDILQESSDEEND